jgi:hypothetical protein
MSRIKHLLLFFLKNWGLIRFNTTDLLVYIILSTRLFLNCLPISLSLCWIRLSLLSRQLLFQVALYSTTRFCFMKCYTLTSLNVVVGASWQSTLIWKKAFDKMEWNFLFSILHKLGFHAKWINWIRLCISTSSFSVLLNGSSFGHFTPSRGLWQGDPLSPFLFIIGTEVISRLLHQSLRGFKISCSCDPLNHLLFADNLVIFTSATSSESSIIKTCLEKYSSW